MTRRGSLDSRSGGERHARLAAAIAVAAWCAGCAFHLRHPLHATRDPSQLRFAAHTSSSLPTGRRPVRLELASGCARHSAHHCGTPFEMPPTGRGAAARPPVRGWYYRGDRPGRKPLVIVLPIYGSSRLPPDILLRYLRRASDGSISLLDVHAEERLFDWERAGAARSEQEVLAALRGDVVAPLAGAVEDLRRLVDWADRQPDVDPGRIGVVGFSIGALVAGVAMGADQRLMAGALLMGGGHLESIFTHCGGAVGRTRKTLLHRFDWSRDDLEGLLRPGLWEVDPVRWAANVAPERVLFFDAALDQCIPRRSRQGLWEALGRPERITFPYVHKLSFLSMTPLGWNYTNRKVWRFFEERFAAAPRRPTRVTAASAR